MSDNSSQRARSNEVISISLIEILLVIVFVLLLLIVANDRNNSEPLQRIEVCEALKESLATLVGPRQVKNIDCSTYQESTLEIISQIKASLEKIDSDIAPIWTSTGITNKPESIESALNDLAKALNADADEVKDKLARVTAEATRLSEEFKRTSEELAQAKQDLAQAREKIAAKEQEIASLTPEKTANALGAGAGKAPGPCLTLNPGDEYPESDYIVIVDLSPPGAFGVKLRPAGRHDKEIRSLIEKGLLPNNLGREKYLTIDEGEFISAFKELKQLGETSTPRCYYQARLLNEKTQIQSKVSLVEEVLYKGG